jgi:DNA-binding MarR family transcriptional regulator
VSEPREYPELANRRRLLEILYRSLQEAYDAEWERLMLVVHTSPVPKVRQWRPSERDIGEELSLRGGEAVDLFRRLENEGYINVSRGQSRGPIGLDMLFLDYLTDKGLREIGQLPHPDERFVEAIEEVLRRIEENPEIPQAEKDRLRRLAEAAITFAKDTGRMGLMQFVLQQMGM